MTHYMKSLSEIRRSAQADAVKALCVVYNEIKCALLALVTRRIVSPGARDRLFGYFSSIQLKLTNAYT